MPNPTGPTGQPAEITFKMTITRAATGEVVTVPMVGHIIPGPPEQAQPATETKQE